ncbi:aldehyde dehydrogenase family protein [Amycolatopsis acidiphila]|uniref:aldehyde dehydrogenase family protein n=1 Tax=Amycolatopsis acidiphila TaxID=715473 RepID=UPI001643DB4C|nr:aldehyde dehydrogenase family protein [Amycolatopsis acidiphila]UIJ61130.1 aldehyde dehydrogenase family protein [Amycolatopsis acidiphila]GHG86538.1 aldehyde dehydrogenase [Amycolatopsis acidiphila]
MNVEAQAATVADDTPLLVGGREYWSDSLHEVRNPAHPEQCVGRIVQADETIAISAIEAAAAALPGWAATPRGERLMHVRQALSGIEAFAADLAPLITREMGKNLRESESEVALPGVALGKYEPHFQRMIDERISDERGDVVVSRAPRGVTTLIVPFNWPVAQLALKLVPALLMGNTVVVKASPLAPLAVTKVVHAIASALPPGVVNAVFGPDSVASVLTTHPAVRTVSFTGSIATGRKVMAAAAASLKHVVLELGGNDPALILADAALDKRQCIRILQAIFSTSGQGCQLIKRIYVHRSRHDELVEKLVACADDYYVVGDGMEPEVNLGPVVTKAQRDRIQNLIERSRGADTTVRETGKVHDTQVFERGWFVRPSFITHVDSDAPIVTDEQFGPVVPIIAFDEEDEALRLANATEFGLAASVWTEDAERGMALGRSIEAGTVFVNNHNTFAIFDVGGVGGVKQSGNGRELGPWGLEEFADLQIRSTRAK